MGILRERVVWRRQRPVRETATPDELTPREGARVRAFLRVLRTNIGSWRKLAKAMGVKKRTLEQATMRKGRRPTAGLLLRAARLAGVCAEMILRGAWPPDGACPHCGRA